MFRISRKQYHTDRIEIESFVTKEDEERFGELFEKVPIIS